MEIKILFRKDLDTEGEFEIAKQYFPVVESRMNIHDSLVLARYSALPFYNELEEDLTYNNSKLINSYRFLKKENPKLQLWDEFFP
jgi:hypothetical protein